MCAAKAHVHQERSRRDNKRKKCSKGLDNCGHIEGLNTHKPAALYEAFAPQEARRIIEKIAWHHPPKHGSWLNMAEVELRVLQRQCLERRLPDQEMFMREVAVWEHQRNQDAVQVHWRFTTEDARIKLKKLYPSF